MPDGWGLPFGLAQEKRHLQPTLHTDAPSVNGRLEIHSINIPRRGCREVKSMKRSVLRWTGSVMDVDCCRFGSGATFRSQRYCDDRISFGSR